MEDDQSKVIFENILNFKSKKELLVLNSVRQLGTICKALGQERTVQELLPFLQDLLEENSVVVSDLLKALVELPLDLSRPASPDNKEAFVAVCYFFEEACTFQERLIRLQAVHGFGQLLGKLSTLPAKQAALQLVAKMKAQRDHEKKMAVTRLLSKLAEVTRGHDELFKSVSPSDFRCSTSPRSSSKTTASRCAALQPKSCRSSS